MLRSMKDLHGYKVHARDGDVGRVEEFYFDDERWTARYVVVARGGWLGRRVLISPVSFSAVDWDGRALETVLTKDQIRKSPDADLEAPISRRYEERFFSYYGYAPYWVGAGYWGPAAYPAALDVNFPAGRAAKPFTRSAVLERPSAEHSHLHSSAEVLGYHIEATDGEIGHVDDFIVDDASWAIRCLHVDTSNWIGGRAVVVPQRALRSVDWPRKRIHVGLSTEQVENSPEYTASLLNRPDYQQRLTDYYRIHV